MKEKKTSATYFPEIHAVSYEAEFRTSPITSESLLNDSGRDAEKLDGPWGFSIDQYDTFLRSRWFLEGGADEHGMIRPPDFDFDRWETVPVPSCWNMTSPECLNYEGGAVYTRRFRYLQKAKGERVFLKVGAANYDCYVFLNKRCVGWHRGGSTTFFVEITDGLSRENRLAFFVKNRRERHQVPADNTDWFNYGGVYRSVELVRVPATFIRRWSAVLVPGSGFGRIRVSLETDGPEKDGEARVRIPELGVDLRFDVKAGRGSLEFEAAPELWEPGFPKLYDVELSCAGADSVSDRIGFREVRVLGTDVLLNGKKIFLKGVSCHEDSLVNGKAVSPDEVAKMFEVARDLGCNFIRLAHYPHTELAARMADELGFLLWEEIPVYWAIDFTNRDTFADAENQLSELVLRDMNRASVVLWSVGNENPDTDERLAFMGDLVRRVRELDPARLVTAACLWNRVRNRIEDRLADLLDVVGINEYFGWYEGNFDDLAAFFRDSSVGKPVIVSEFGADAPAGNFGTVDEIFTENHQRMVYERQVAVIGSAPYVAGMTPWILFDFRCPRRHHPLQGGFNRKGLVHADKERRKLAFHTLKAFYSGR